MVFTPALPPIHTNPAPQTPLVSAIQGASPLPATAGIATQTQTAEALVGQIPPAIAALPKATLLNVLVATKDSQGNYTLKAPQGEVLVKSSIPLNVNTNLLLKIAPPVTAPGSSPLFQAQIISINDIPVQKTNPGIAATITSLAAPPPETKKAPEPAAPKTAPRAEAATTIQVSTPQTTTGSIVKALVSQPAPQQAAIPYLPAPEIAKTETVQAAKPGQPQALKANALKANDSLALHIIGLRLPVASTPATSSAIPVAVDAPETSETAEEPAIFAKPISATPTSKPNTAPITNDFSSLPVTSLPSFPATVTGTEKSGDILVQTPLGLLKIATPISLPAGTELTLEVTSHTPAQAAKPLAVSGAISANLHLGETLEELIDTVKNLDSPPLTGALKRILPEPGPLFAGRLLHFIGAVAQQNIPQWLGSELSAALNQAGKTDIIQKLQKEFGRLRQLSTEGMGNSTHSNQAGWNALLFPVYVDDKLQYGTMYVRHQEEQETEEEKLEEGTRFIIELTTQQNGDLQLDGFMKTRARRLELNVRSKTAFPFEMREDIQSIFHHAASVTGISGQIEFQVMKQFPVTPQAMTQASNSSASPSGLFA